MRRVTPIVAAVLVALLVPLQAAAGQRESVRQQGGSSSATAEGAAAFVWQATWGAEGSPADGREGTVPCFGSVVAGEVAQRFRPPGAEPVPDDEHWVVVTCHTGPANVSWIAAVYRLADSPPVAALVERAASYLVVPEPSLALSPPVGALHLVGVPEYLATDPAAWRPYSASASLPGVTVTVTAAPLATIWDTGDGAVVVCDGPGTRWGARARSDCTHAYARPGTYPLTVTTTWARTWACVPGCGGGTLPTLARRASEPLTVTEAQALITAIR
jgi:hypothetical protein